MCESTGSERENHSAAGLLVLIVLLLIAVACAGFVAITLPEALDAVACVINDPGRLCHRAA